MFPPVLSASPAERICCAAAQDASPIGKVDSLTHTCPWQTGSEPQGLKPMSLGAVSARLEAVPFQTCIYETCDPF